MTVYETDIKPGMQRHPEWKRLDQKIKDLREKLEGAEAERINFESSYVARFYYPSSED